MEHETAMSLQDGIVGNLDIRPVSKQSMACQHCNNVLEIPGKVVAARYIKGREPSSFQASHPSLHEPTSATLRSTSHQPPQSHRTHLRLRPRITMFKKSLALLATLTAASLAMPAPQTSNDQYVNDSMNVDQANQQCGNDQALSCCNNENGSEGGPIAGILDDVLGGSCNQMPISCT